MEFLTDIFTVEEAARYLKIPVSSIYKLAQEGKIPAQKIGRHWRFHKSVLEKWFEKYPVTDLPIKHNDKESIL